MRWLLVALLAVHGLIHLMGFAKAFGLAELEALTRPVSRSMGVVWLLAATGFLLAALLLLRGPRLWWWVAVARTQEDPPALTGENLAALPAPVARYLRTVGALGKQRPV